MIEGVSHKRRQRAWGSGLDSGVTTEKLPVKKRGSSCEKTGPEGKMRVPASCRHIGDVHSKRNAGMDSWAESTENLTCPEVIQVTRLAPKRGNGVCQLLLLDPNKRAQSRISHQPID
jgi:hypothetical protein